LLDSLASVTHAAVFASTDTTGADGNWSLEAASAGTNPNALSASSIPLNATVLASYKGVLAGGYSVTVDTTSDVVDGDTSSISALLANPGADGVISLREAIIAADNTVSATPITIDFDIPGSGAQTINLLSALPALTDSVIIDATSQPGYAGTPLIVLNGSSAGANVAGLNITGGGSTIRGLVIDNFSQYGISISTNGGNTIAGNYIGTNAAGTSAAGNGIDGIVISSNNNFIGGTTAADRNIISGNTSDGVFITSGNNNQIVGNYIGTDVTGTAALANVDEGVEIAWGTGNIVGGTAVGSGNVISGNGQLGVWLYGSNGVAATSNIIEGNLIGTNAAGTAALGNVFGGIQLGDADANTIGGTSAAARNVISGNLNYGILLESSSSNNLVQGNFIGTAADGVTGLGNVGAGVEIDTGASNNTIGGTAAGQANIIAYNAGIGVEVLSATATGDSIEGNSIYDNSALGIDLGGDGVTSNHVGNVSGPNNLQNYPVLANAFMNGTNLSIAGTLNALPTSIYNIDFYWSPVGDPSGHGQAETYIGSTSVTTSTLGDASINATFDGVSVPVGAVVTATATDSSRNTSEFALNVTVTQVNQAPSGTNNTVTTLENTAYTFAAADFGFHDPNIPPNSLLAVEITTLPGAGALSDNGVAVTAGQFVSAADINAGKLVFTPVTNTHGTSYTSFTFQVENNGGTADGGVDLDPSPKTMTVNVTQVNQPPVNTVPAAQSTADATPLVFSVSNGNAISVIDADSGGNIEQISLSVGNGSLTLSGTAGLTFVAGANGSAAMTVQGTLANLNNALNGLTYVSTKYYNGSDTLTLVSNDLGNTGVGGPLTATSTVMISVNHVNQAPVNTVPGAQSTNEGTSLVFSNVDGNPISVADPDAGSNPILVALSVTHGTLTLNGSTGLTITSGANGSSSVSVQGTITGINAALNGLIYTPTPGFYGPAGLGISTNDLGHTGSGGAKTTTSGVAITVTQPIVLPPLPPSPPVVKPSVPDPEPNALNQPQTPSILAASANSLPAAAVSPRQPAVALQPMPDMKIFADVSTPQSLVEEFSAEDSESGTADLKVHTYKSSQLGKLPNARTALMGRSECSYGVEGSPLWDDLDSLQKQMKLGIDARNLFVGSALTLTTSLTVGYVLWLIRGGLLVSSLVAQMPAWCLVDPLIVLSCVDDDTPGDRGGGHEESLGTIVDTLEEIPEPAQEVQA
jgi:hypothetical protein